jgi:hypothetical protein
MNTIGDIVLIHNDKGSPFYSLIEDINPDIKKGWWVVSFILLVYPHSKYSWLLRDEQLQGEEFTMNGNKIKIEEFKPITTDEKKEIIKKPTLEKFKREGNVVFLRAKSQRPPVLDSGGAA